MFAALVWAVSAAAGAAAEDDRGRDRPASDGRAGRGKGVIAKIVRGNRIAPEAFELVRGNPYVTAVQVTVTWAELEPRKGEYRWNEVEQLLEQYGATGKSVVLMFAVAGGKVPTAGQMNKRGRRADPDMEFENRATPAWLFEESGVRRVGGVETPHGTVPLYPVFWDPAYQAHLGRFLAAFAHRFDGDARIEFIRMGGWQIGTNEPSFYGGASMLLRDQLVAEGEQVGGRRRPRLSGDGRYAQAVRDLVDLWCTHFRKTRLAATVHLDTGRGLGFEAVMNDHCARKGCTLLNTGLNERDHAGARSFFRRMHDERGCKVGWGGITHLGGKNSRRAERSPEQGLLLDAFKQGIGDDGQAGYEPASRASYVVVGLNSLREVDALKWVDERLVD